ncbi:MAG: GTP pyrophosphokinase [Candidatus Schekmanbacteria bacterium GWA2_38_9]|uniref:GTP pyrophosphokinase n=1 Tax=Candidatus Schekmanbacteria bacterium RIFCSPLOWO2_12_FULL_38_15 TaxID=1817883 RepID=A0A1F7SFF9_9BACT|nr:MAG: GTP pyrophosphokinase [Candidatus Schekmanbacteria bacterium GWA2_38_9]OGL50607.1 MAG: GTP pyrophosphokinase [Candidatus Schekmanbacteria bacterium RIFCSPLOWO2_02_FULL_38_14]OGL52471.1 MAG: GTP pyrophosphokinase [Candidatus Schekmanbacteria bacterium RIFCSPLOWO2_12_FULL_38_15]
MIRCEELIDKINSYIKGKDGFLIRKAYIFSAKVHRDQQRMSGEPYFFHPLEVANILADLRLDIPTIAAGILHDTIENTEATLSQLTEMFGEEIAALVDGVTKIGRIEFTSSEEQQSENFRKMILAMSKDIRVLLIKLADRVHNMRTLEHLPHEKQRIIAKETADIYAPLANRLGIGWMKWELEDLALRFLNSQVYYELAKKISKKRNEREKYIEEVRGIILSHLKQANLDIDVAGRPKHFNSIYQKMIKQNISFDEVYDLLGFRIVTKSVSDCYATLGIIHSIWTPVPGRFKDYIAMPKANMYQSLHTTVIGPSGQRIEIQIRTSEMNKIAEEGIAAHWVYKEKGEIDNIQSERFNWLRQLIDWQGDMKDPREFMEGIKMDLFPQEVYIFTPKGDVKSLPKGATPVDFAYSIHTDVGHRCVGTRVNGKMVPLREILKSGDTVDIITSQVKHPSKDWLKFVVTPRAKSKIKQFIKDEEANESLKLGTEICEREFKRYNLNPTKLFCSQEFVRVYENLGFHKADQLFTAIGYGRLAPFQIASKFLPKETLQQQEAKKESRIRSALKRVMGRKEEGIKIKDLDNILIRFAKCCNPVPGDEIRGFITRGRGVTVHTRSCPFISKIDIDPQRRIDVEWDLAKETKRPVRIIVVSTDKKGILAKVTSVIASNNINITSAQINTNEDKKATMDFVLEVGNVKQLNKTIKDLKGLKEITLVERVGG